MRNIIFILAMLAISSVIVAQPKVATIYSAGFNYAFKGDQTYVLKTLGWAEDMYENTQIKDLVVKLNEYDMVLTNAIFNWTNIQDLSVYADDFRKYVEAGGCLVITDANYESTTSWLTDIDPDLKWEPTGTVNNDRKPMTVANDRHPLTAGEPAPGESWTHPKPISTNLTPLYFDKNGVAGAAMKRIGSGTVVVSGSYSHTHWPSKEFLMKLYSWNKGGAAMKVSAGEQVFESEIQISEPKYWFLGSNTIKVTLDKDKAKSSDAVLNMIDCKTGRVISSKDIKGTTGASVKVNFDLDVKSAGLTPIQFVLVDAKDKNLILASSALVKAESGPLLKLSMVTPVVRGTIQSKDRVRKVVVEGAAASARGEKVTLDCVVTNSLGEAVHKSGHKIKNPASFRVSINAAKLPVGKYDFKFTLLRNDRESAVESLPLVVAAPAKTEVSFDENHNCYVNGEPFFPIGLYHVSPAAFDALNKKSREAGLPEFDLFEEITKLKDMGFNVIHHTWGMPSEEYLAHSQSLGMWVMPEVAAPTREQVALANKYNNVLMWYGQDEPSGEALDFIKRARAQTAEYDPNRPVSAAVCNPTLFKNALDGFDFLMMDPYLIRYAPLAGIGDWVDKGLKDSDGHKAIWLVPQAFTIDSSNWKEPTPDELRCQAYIGLVHGVKGFVWYAYWSPEPWTANPVGRGYWALPDSKLWDAFPKLNAEVNELAPILMFGKNRGAANCSSKDIHTRIWEYKGKKYLIAVNTLYTPVECRITGIDGNVELLFEGENVKATNGVLREWFKPLEARIYVF